MTAITPESEPNHSFHPPCRFAKKRTVGIRIRMQFTVAACPFVSNPVAHRSRLSVSGTQGAHPQ